MDAVTDEKIAARWGMPPIAYASPLPGTGISIARWRRMQASGPFTQRIIEIDYYLVSLILKPMNATSFIGSRRIWSGPIRANSVRIVDPDGERQWSCDGEFDLLHVTLPKRSIAEMIDGEPDRIRFSDPLYSHDDTIQQLGHQILWAMAQHSAYGAQMVGGLTQALIAYILQQYSSGGASAGVTRLSPARLRRVVDLVEQRVSTDISLHEMAKEAGMSPFHFSRQFRLATGETPYRYTLIRRIEGAKEKLRGHHADILEVALSCGFKDASHFSRVFKAIAGVTPREYRRHN